MKTLFMAGILLSLSTQQSQAAIKRAPTELLTPVAPVTVAIVDTGTDISHRDLRDSIWTNPGESGLDLNGRDKSTNGIDDDHNGYVDDVHGWNFITNTNDVSDSDGHGTHIAGIIKSEFSKRARTPSDTSSQQVRFMILKYYSPEHPDTDSVRNTAKAIEYAARMQAQVINYSGGGAGASKLEMQAIAEAAQKNIPLIAAAGNNNSDTDHQRYYPANYPLKNIISVAAVSRSGELLDFSNYGPQSIDIAAPGYRVYSTLPHNKFGFMSGTSQATAFISGAAASLIAEHYGQGDYTPTELLQDLLADSLHSKALQGKTRFQMAFLN
jgi:subtilisin family serine protease